VKKRERLIRFLSARAVGHEERLAAMRAQAEALRQRPDVVWLVLLQSAATMGNSRGWNGLFEDSMLPTLIGFNAVGAIRPDLRASYMAPILQTASVRMPRQKAEALARNHDIISDLGGEAAARASAFAQPTRDSKIAFMKRFHGIGDKYARNVWMDLYDPHFHDAIAYDERLKKIAAALGARFQSYVAAEQYFTELAQQSGREPWEVDRILYHFNGDALDAIACAG
jgi:hypothetical protein